MKTLRNLLMCAVLLFAVSCDKDWDDINSHKVALSDITIECISETTISNNTSANRPFTKHTYLCKGYVEDISGECSIKVLHDNFIVHNNHKLVVAGGKMPFEFTFAPEWGYLDNPNNTFTVQLYTSDDVLACQTTIVVTQHAKDDSSELVDVPYLEYSLWGTQCEWQLPDYNNSIIVVDSDEELARYITSESGGKYPAVDFTKYTMIIAGGGASRGIYDVIVDSLQQLSDTEYSLNISVVMSKTDAPELWTKALLVDKWDKLCKVNLEVKTIDLIN